MLQYTSVQFGSQHVTRAPSPSLTPTSRDASSPNPVIWLESLTVADVIWDDVREARRDVGTTSRFTSQRQPTAAAAEEN